MGEGNGLNDKKIYYIFLCMPGKVGIGEKWRLHAM